MDIEAVLGDRMNMAQVRGAVEWAVGNRVYRGRLWELAQSENRRMAVNALWVMSHLPESEKEWLESLQEEMTGMLVVTDDTAKKRILLQLLREQTYPATEEDFRGELLDFCFSKINSECETYAVRCFSIYVAFKICMPYPELIAELEGHLDMMDCQELSPGLKSALRQTRKRIAALRKKR